MAYLSSLEEAKTFWANRKTYLVFHDPDLPEKIVNYDNDLQNRIQREEHEKHCHISQRTFLPTPQTVAGVNQVTIFSRVIQQVVHTCNRYRKLPLCMIDPMISTMYLHNEYVFHKFSK